MIAAMSICVALLVDPVVSRPGRRPDLARDWLPTCVRIARLAEYTGTPVGLAVSTAWHESRLDRRAVGAVGEVGPMQVRPETWCRREGGRCSDPMMTGVRVLARYLVRHREHAVCRYRGARPGCASERIRRGMAARLEGAAWAAR